MNTRARFSAFFGVLALLGSMTAHAQGDWDVIVNGRAVHMHAQGEWNEANWGVGFEREFNGSGRWVKLALANGFKDSLGEPSYMAGGGIKRRFRMFADDLYFDVGVVGFLMTREDVGGNRPFPGALPAVTFGSKRVAVNITYMPDSIVDRVTRADLTDPAMRGVFFVQLKLDASLFGFGGGSRGLLAQAANNSNQ